MSNAAMLRLLRETIHRRGARPAREQIDEMVKDHVIDRDGNVLLRRPESSPWSSETTEKATTNGDHR